MYSILNILYSNGAKSKLYALSQKDIIEALAAVDPFTGKPVEEGKK